MIGLGQVEFLVLEIGVFPLANMLLDLGKIVDTVDELHDVGVGL